MTLDTRTLPGALAVRIPVDGQWLDADLEVPAGAKGLIVFAHSVGNGRRSSHTLTVVRRLHAHAFGTLSVDLLTEDESRNFRSQFDTDLLAERLSAVPDWIGHELVGQNLPVGYLATSTAAAAALRVAVSAQDIVRAVVTRGGRVDLAEDVLEELQIPTLLIVGQNDYGVLEANQEAFLKMTCKKELAVLPHTSHLLEKSSALDRVAVAAARWFNTYLDNGTSHNRRTRPGN